MKVNLNKLNRAHYFFLDPRTSMLLEMEQICHKPLNFQYSFYPLSHIWSWMLGNDKKSAITSESVQNEVFTKNWRSYTGYQDA